MTSNKNTAFFEALDKVEPVTETSNTSLEVTPFMSIADYRASKPEGEIENREVVEGDNSNFDEAIERLENLREEFLTEERLLMVDEIDIIIALLTGRPLPDTSDRDDIFENTGKLDDKSIAEQILQKLMYREGIDNLEEFLDGYDDFEEFSETYINDISELLKLFDVDNTEEEKVLSDIVELIDPYL